MPLLIPGGQFFFLGNLVFSTVRPSEW